MRFKPNITFGVLGPAAGLGAFFVALQLQVAAMPTIGAASIDRALKGDRLPFGPTVARPLQPSAQPPLPEGCVDASHWHLDTMYSAEIPGRCVG